MRKKCELCGGLARMYCESDQASLCWVCDEKVHGANFLVAEHTRCLLCSACQSPTPWKAAGSRLGPTVSACNSCASLQNSSSQNLQHPQFESQSQETNGHDYDEDDGHDGESRDEDDDEEEEYGDDESEDAENQVVPWAANMPAAEQAAPPAAASVSSSSSISSGEEDFSRGGGGSAMKRMRGNSDFLFSDDEIGCCFSQETNYWRPRRSRININCYD